MQGTEIFIVDGFAEVEFTDPATRGQLLGKLVIASREAGVRIRTSSAHRRRRYIVPEHIAEEAGLLDTATEEPQQQDEAPSSSPETGPEPVKDTAETKDDETYPVAPPRPGHKGATKAAWTGYAQAIGVEVDPSMTLQDIYEAVVAKVGAPEE